MSLAGFKPRLKHLSTLAINRHSTISYAPIASLHCCANRPPRRFFDDNDQKHSPCGALQGQTVGHLPGLDGLQKHTAFTGTPAKISPAVGGRFTAWGPHLAGINVDLVKNKRIVQAWRAANWPKGHFSLVTFVLKPTQTGTLLDFTHVGIPAQRVRSINSGWKSHYWDLLKAALERKSER